MLLGQCASTLAIQCSLYERAVNSVLVEASLGEPTFSLREAFGSLGWQLLDWKEELQIFIQHAETIEAELGPLEEAQGVDLVAELRVLEEEIPDDAPLMLSYSLSPEEKVARRRAHCLAAQEKLDKIERAALCLLNRRWLFPELAHHTALLPLQRSDLLKPHRRLNLYVDVEPLPVNSRHPVMTGLWQGHRKILKQYPASQSKAVFRELAILQHLASDLVVEVTAVFEDGHYLFIEMPCYAGGTLLDWVQSAPRSDAEIVCVVREILLAMQHLHSNNVIHCDVKPDNIFIDGGHVRIGDFDISRTSAERCQWLVSELRTRTQVGGTTAYAAPELLRDQEFVAPATKEADLYSMGLSLFELLSPLQAGRRAEDPYTARTGLSEVRRTLLELAASFQAHLPQDRPSLDEALQNPIFDHPIPPHSGNFPLYWSLVQPSYSHSPRIDVTTELGSMIENLMNDSSFWVEPGNRGNVRLGRCDPCVEIVHGQDGQGTVHKGFRVLACSITLGDTS